MKFTYVPEARPLDGYTLKRAIHRGGFGEVYYALSDAGREVALKLLQNNTEVELRGVQQCLNLSHPNLVTIFDVKQDAEGDYWIVMEYVAGETLDQALRKHPQGMPVEQVRRWMSGIVEGVSYLHSRAIVHRDLKPGNVFSDGSTVKVGDIGLSKFITQSRRSAHTQSVGTVYYMAPEVAKGRYGKEVDVYALGIMLYEMLTGDVPFNGESTGEILLKHLSEAPDLSRLPPRLRPVVGKALSKDPALRFASLKEFEKAFTDAVLGKSLLVTQPPGENPPPQASAPPQAQRAEVEACQEGHSDRETLSRSHTRNLILTGVALLLALLVIPRMRMGDTLFLIGLGVVGTIVLQNRRLLWSGSQTQQRKATMPPPPAAPMFAARPMPANRPRPALAQLLEHCSTGSCLSVPVTVLLTAGLAFLEPSLFGNLIGQSELDPGSIALFGIMTVLASWGAMSLPVLARVIGYEGHSHLRMHGLLVGAVLGLVAGGLDSFLMVDMPVENWRNIQNASFTMIGERPLMLEHIGPTTLGYIVFFAALFALRNWTGLVSVQRDKRFSIVSVLWTVVLAYGIAHLFAFDHEWALAWGAMIACVVQVSTPWSGVLSRTRRRN